MNLSYGMSRGVSDIDRWLLVISDFEIGVKATGKLSRNAFGVGKNLPVMMVSDEVDLRILGEFNKAY